MITKNELKMKNLFKLSTLVIVLIFVSSLFISCENTDVIVNMKSVIKLDSINLYEGRPFTGIGIHMNTKKNKNEPLIGYFFEDGKFTGTEVRYKKTKEDSFYVENKIEMKEDYILKTEYYPNGEEMTQGKYIELNNWSGNKGYPNSEVLFWTLKGDKIVVGHFDKDSKLIQDVTKEEIEKLMTEN